MDSNIIVTQLRALAAQIEAGGAAPAGRVLAPSGIPIDIVWLPDGTAAADFWARGYLGCMKGAHNKHYAEAHVLMGLVGGDIPRHCSIIQPVPVTLPWAEALISAADAGWIDGSGYNPTPTAGAFQRWCDAGCPSKNGNAVYDVRGQPIADSAWSRVFAGIAGARAQGGAV